MFRKPGKKELAWRSELRYLRAVVSGIAHKKVIVREIAPPVLACADEKGSVFIVRDHPEFDRIRAEITQDTEKGRQIVRLLGEKKPKKTDLADDAVRMIRLGLCVHEALHILLTNFSYEREFLEKKKANGELNYEYEYQEFLFIQNMVEDPAIEGFGSQYVGGVAIKALRFTIASLDLMRGDFNLVAEGTFPELCNALIQFGDMGVLHGEFQHPEAKKAFAEIAPMFYDAINEPDNRKRIDKSWDIFMKLKSLWQDKAAEEMEEFIKQIKAAFENLLKNDPNILNKKSTGQNSAPQPQSNLNQKRNATIKKVSREEYEAAKELMKNQPQEEASEDEESVILLPEDFNEEDAREMIEEAMNNQASSDNSSNSPLPVPSGQNGQSDNGNSQQQPTDPSASAPQETQKGDGSTTEQSGEGGKERSSSETKGSETGNACTEDKSGTDSSKGSGEETETSGRSGKTGDGNEASKDSDADTVAGGTGEETDTEGQGESQREKPSAKGSGLSSEETEGEEGPAEGANPEREETAERSAGGAGDEGSEPEEGNAAETGSGNSEAGESNGSAGSGDSGKGKPDGDMDPEEGQEPGGEYSEEEGEEGSESSEIGASEEESSDGEGSGGCREQTGKDPDTDSEESGSYSESGDGTDSTDEGRGLEGGSPMDEKDGGNGRSPIGISNESIPAELTEEEEALLQQEEDPCFVDNDFSSVMNGVQKEREALEEELAEAEEYYSEISDFSKAINSAEGFEGVRSSNLYVERVDEAMTEQYDKLVEELAEYVEPFKDEIDGIFEADRVRKEFAETGKRVNLKRVALHMGARVFERKTLPGDRNDVAFCIAVDNSGSTRGDKNLQEKIACVGIAEALAELEVPLYVFGFNVSGGNNPVQTHYIRWENTRFERERLLCMQASGCNFDSYSIRYATQLLEERTEHNKMLIVISDGCPSAYFDWEEGILQNALAVNEARSLGIKVLGMSVGTDIEESDFVRMYGRDGYVSVLDPKDLFDSLSERIKSVIEEG